MIEALVITRGHPFEREPFFEMLDAVDGVRFTHVEQPAALALFEPARAEPFDVFVLYDMPGIEFRAGEAPVFHEPPARFKDDFSALLGTGTGIVAVHHAAAGWPAWPAYAETIGSTFLYQPGRFGGREWPDSGYAMDVDIRVTPVDADHPVVAGLEDGFELNDEVYLGPVLTDEVVPLLRCDWTYRADRFAAAGEAIGAPSTEPGRWSHPDGSDLVAWARRAGSSPLVYLQSGHGPATYAHPSFRRLLGNAIAWAASDDARRWARSER